MVGDNVVMLFIGLYFVSGALAMKTKNFQSALVFKIIPMISGLFLLLVSIRGLGWI